jgi:hypothetical protein
MMQKKDACTEKYNLLSHASEKVHPASLQGGSAITGWARLQQHLQLTTDLLLGQRQLLLLLLRAQPPPLATSHRQEVHWASAQTW